MGNKIPDMVDMVFDLRGGLVPADYAFALWDEAAYILPWLEAEETAGMLPLRGSVSGTDWLLPQRAKLVLRLPVGVASKAVALSGQELALGSCMLQVGKGKERPLQAYTTLHAQMVESADEEERFLADMEEQLRALEVSCKWICGKRHSVSGAGRSLDGYSLVLHDLKPEASLQVQRAGLGGNRRFGCGVFVPYKDISGLD
ncbi:MAG: type I-MYXAN CRISPR-associated protein Cas6/Cmx6 [Nitrosomonadales bacterium]|nr:type I-MYXAN CRISPR-associated protein Cas6/Cmx6 [Nitrosomonadales bacterium]